MRPDSQYSDRRRSNGGRRDGRPRSSRPASAPPKPLSLWQRIVAVFTGNGGKQTPRNGSPSRANYSARERTQPDYRGGSRKPEVIEVSSPKLYVGNLSFDATESDLFELFNGVGQVQNAEVVANKYTQKSKGFAFVTMQTVEEAKRAVTELHDKDFMGRKLVVSGAKVNDMRDAA